MSTTETTTDRRQILSGPHVVTQVRQSNGEWWNITIRTATAEDFAARGR